jgi:type I restriction enzyme S subunit
MANKLPEGWKNKSLKDICLVVKDKGNDGDFPYLEIGNIDLNSKRYAFSDKRAVKGCKRAQQNDVLVSRVRPTRGAIVSIKEDSLAVSSAFTILRSQKDKITDRYLLRSLSGNQSFLNYMGNNCTGTMYPTVSEKTILEYLISVAPIDKQERIADKLDSLLAKVKDAQSRLDKIPIILDRFRQSILAAAFSGKLTKEWRKKNKCSEVTKLLKRNEYEIANESELVDLPDSWKWCALGNYADCSRGRFSIRPRNDSRYYNGKYPFIQIGDLPREGGYINKHSQTLNDLGLGISKMFPKGAVAIAIVGATIANTGILGYDMCFPDSMVGIETGDEIRNRYCELFLRYKKHEIRQEAYSSGGQPNIKLQVLNPLPIALAPKEEQAEIVRRVDCQFHIIAGIEARCQAVKKYSDKLEQSVLAKAFRGELVQPIENEEKNI